MYYNIYALNNEKYDLSNSLFNSELLDEGKNNACTKILWMLEEKQIDVIYVSPFARCMNTILPYAEKYNIDIHVDYRLYEWYNNLQFIDEPVQSMEITDKISSITCADIKLLYPESLVNRNARVDDFMKMLDKKYENTYLNILVCSHMDILHDVLNYKIKAWPHGYLNTGTLIDVQHVQNHIAKMLIIYAQFCNYFMPLLHHGLNLTKYKESLKQQISFELKKWQQHSSSLYITTKWTESIGLLKKKTTRVFSKVNQCLVEVYLQMKWVWEKQ